MTAEEVKATHVRVLGAELGGIYNALYNEAVWLHLQWQQYRKLFVENEHLDVLNEAAGALFFIIQQTLADNTILSISRLTGLPKTGQANLTVRLLPKMIRDPGVARAVEEQITLGEPSWHAAKKWRDKHLAHLDLAVALGHGATPLPPVTRTIIEDALRAIRNVLNRIEKASFRSEVFYEVREPLDADALVGVIRLGLKFDADRHRRLLDGQTLPGDWDES